jgi:hypothetical protein
MRNYFKHFYIVSRLYLPGTAHQTKEGRSSSIQKQFERMNVVFNEIRDRMDKQDAVITTWHEGIPKESLMLEGKKGVQTLMIMKTIKLH